MVKLKSVAWYLLKNRRHIGPHSLVELKAAVKQGRAQPRDYVIDAQNLKSGLLKYQYLQDLIPEIKKLNEEVPELSRFSESNDVTGHSDFENANESSIHIFSQMDSNDFVKNEIPDQGFEKTEISTPVAHPLSLEVAKVAEPDSRVRTGSIFLLRMEGFQHKKAFYGAAVLLAAFMGWKYYPGPIGHVATPGRREASEGQASPLAESEAHPKPRNGPAVLQMPTNTRPAPAPERPAVINSAAPPPPPSNPPESDLPPPEPAPGAERGDLLRPHRGGRPGGFLPPRQNQNLNEIQSDSGSEYPSDNPGRMNNNENGVPAQTPEELAEPGVPQENLQ